MVRINDYPLTPQSSAFKTGILWNYMADRNQRPFSQRQGLHQIIQQPGDDGVSKLASRNDAQTSLPLGSIVVDLKFGDPHDALRRHCERLAFSGFFPETTRYRIDFIYSARMRAMFSMLMPLGQAASHSAWLEQLPKPSASIWPTIFWARLLRSA